MGLLADQPAGSPFAPIDLVGLDAAELDCLAVLVFGAWAEIRPVASTVTGAHFADRDRGVLYDAIARLRADRPSVSLARRLHAVPDVLVPTVSVVLRWSDRPGFEASADVMHAAASALRHEPGSTHVPR